MSIKVYKHYSSTSNKYPNVFGCRENAHYGGMVWMSGNLNPNMHVAGKAILA